jgi:hypothetical protein
MLPGEQKLVSQRILAGVLPLAISREDKFQFGDLAGSFIESINHRLQSTLIRERMRIVAGVVACGMPVDLQLILGNRYIRRRCGVTRRRQRPESGRREAG